MPLAYYSTAPTQEFWTEHWGGEDLGALLGVARRSPLTALIESALPQHGRVLEAGCGPGQYVVVLRERGHAAVGVDWSVEALQRGRAAWASVPLAAMDLRAMAVRGAALDACVSLGVMEHDVSGPDTLLREAHRVLRPDGVLLVSVPYLNGVRRVARRFIARAQSTVRDHGGAFYQYAFTRRELTAILERHGFGVRALTPYDPARLLRRALRSGSHGVSGGGPVAADLRATTSNRAPVTALLRRTARLILYTRPGLRLLGHMILAVAVKGR